MLVFLGIIELAVAAFLLSIFYIAQKDSEEIVPSAIIGGMFAVFIILGAICIGEHFCPSISPIDVYRGKTTLEITYKDGVAIDSVVVWKEETK